MKETKVNRIQRLTARKEELLRQKNTLSANTGLKAYRLINQIQTITNKITELKGD